jgi:hypothetical protein
MLRNIKIFLMIFIIIVCCENNFAQDISENEKWKTNIPNILQEWLPWVLRDHNFIKCPVVYADGNASEMCNWYDTLQLNLSDTNGTFKQEVLLYKDSEIILPGGLNSWPATILVNDVKLPIATSKKGLPALNLKSGNYTISGSFYWNKLPISIEIPEHNPLIKLSVNDEIVQSLQFDNLGKLILQPAEEDNNNVTKLEIFRKFTDELPSKLETRIQIKASGKSRNLNLSGVSLGGKIYKMESALPLRLQLNGDLVTQIRPGEWTIIVSSFLPTPLSKVVLPTFPEPWPQEELWSFSSKNNLRSVDISGISAISPQQTNIPAEWGNLPAYLVHPHDTLLIQEQSRGGSSKGQESLTLARHLKLSFDGQIINSKDVISGVLVSTNRIHVSPAMDLGRVSINGQDQMVSRLKPSDPQGIEVREGSISIEAESKINFTKQQTIPATGWDHHIDSLSAQLELPPGWDLFNATGVDRAPNSWIELWSLLDIFLVLVSSVLAYKLTSFRGGLITFFALVLVNHNFPISSLVITLLALSSLLKVLPSGKFYRLTFFLWKSGIIALSIATLIFLVSHVRTALYPQLLFYSNYNPSFTDSRISAYDHSSATPNFAQESRHESKIYNDSAGYAPLMRGQSVAKSKLTNQYIYDENNIIQTGYGLPNWNGKIYQLNWNGPVEPNENISLTLLSPRINLLLAGGRVFLLLGLLYVLSGGSFRIKKIMTIKSVITFFIVSLILSNNFVYAENTKFPNSILLEDLKKYALEKLVKDPPCRADCIQINQLDVKVANSKLELLLEIHAQEKGVLPIPLPAKNWSIDSLEFVDRSESTKFVRLNNAIQLIAPNGISSLKIIISLGSGDVFDIHFPIVPKISKLSAEGWRVEGITKDGVMDQDLKLIRLADNSIIKSQPNFSEEVSSLPYLLNIERQLNLGITWSVTTIVSRISPIGNVIKTTIPLIDDEVVTTDKVNIKDREIELNLDTYSENFTWESNLPISDKLFIIAPARDNLTEVWKVNVSNLWNAKFSGTPRIYSEDSSKNGIPEWHPRPSETLNIDLIRPFASKSATKTIDNVFYNLEVGKKVTNANLKLDIRSSSATKHTISIPKNSQLLELSINQKPLVVNSDISNKIPIFLNPGKQQVQLLWRQNQGIQANYQTPKVNLGIPAVNIETVVSIPLDRWVWFTAGSTMGPAVLFLSLLPLLAIISILLGKLKITILNCYEWFLLLFGLTQNNYLITMIVVGWLIVIGNRSRRDLNLSRKFTSRISQLFIVILTIATIFALIASIETGLLGTPDMKIAGNGSSTFYFRWYQDAITGLMPDCTIFSLPISTYRTIMLLWAMWLAVAVTKWYKWAWQSFSRGGHWV